MDLYKLLSDSGIEPESTLVLRHRPLQPQIRKELMWFASENQEVYNAYQQCQSPRVERQMQQAWHVASFIGHEPGHALFVGVYANGTPRKVSQNWRSRNPGFRILMSMGLTNAPRECLFFDLNLTTALAHWQGKLVIKWPGREVSFSRWAHKNSGFDVAVIHEESILVRGISDWRSLVLKWDELERIPRSWRAALNEWCGIYYIFDSVSKKGYVGAAYGKENLLGRWLSYARTGHGGNRQLRKINPAGLRFSILERLSPDTPASEVIACENGWKERLHTRKFGLNDN